MDAKSLFLKCGYVKSQKQKRKWQERIPKLVSSFLAFYLAFPLLIFDFDYTAGLA